MEVLWQIVPSAFRLPKKEFPSLRFPLALHC
jgi:hypothetical protein